MFLRLSFLFLGAFQCRSVEVVDGGFCREEGVIVVAVIAIFLFLFF